MQKISPPKDLFPYVIEFTKFVSPNNNPFFIEITTNFGSVIKECVKNVENYIKLHRGEKVFGWKIWEWYGIMIEAEFHTVWRSPSGELQDITPEDQPFKRVLFLQDTTLEYKEEQVDNIRKPLNDSPDVEEYIKAHQSLFEFMNRGDRKSQHGEIDLTNEEMTEWSEVQRNILKLEMKITDSVPKRNDLCRCGSGIKSKKCCFP